MNRNYMVRNMSVSFVCKVDDVARSYIPNIFILTLSCDKATIKMDIHREVNIVDRGDNVEITISKTLPPYEDGKDFVARGYVITKREHDGAYKLLISLWGFLVIVETKDKSIVDTFSHMDEIFFKMSKRLP